MFFTIPNFLSTLYFVAFIFYILMGLYLIIVDHKYVVNRLYALTLLSLALWALAYSYSIDARDVNFAFIARRFGAVGWSMMPVLYLHTTLVITRGKAFSPTKKIMRVLMYIPAFVNTYNFSFSSKITRYFYILKQTDYGWQNFGTKCMQAYFSYVYIIIYSLIAVILTFYISKYGKLIRERLQAKILSYSFLGTIIVCGTTDILLPLLLHVVCPEVAVIIGLFPMYLTWKSIVEYGVTPIFPQNIAKEIISNMNEGVITVDKNYNINSINSNAIEILELEDSEYFGEHFIHAFNDEDKNISQYFGSPNEIDFNDSNFSFTKSFKKTIVTKNQKRLHLLLAIAPIFDELKAFAGGCIIIQDMTEVYDTQEQLKSTYDSLDVVVQSRTKELINSNTKLTEEMELREKRNDWENLILFASNSLMNIDSHNIVAKTHMLLEKVGKYFDVDRCFIQKFDFEDDRIYNTYAWTKDEGFESPLLNKKIILSVNRWSVDKLDKGILYIQNVNEMPISAREAKNALKNDQIKTCLGIPISSKNNYSGCLRLDTISKAKVWTDEEIKMLIVFSNLLIDAIAKVDDSKKIIQLAYYDALTLLPNKYKISETINSLIETIKDEPHAEFAILLLDLDSFKNINDSLGHEAGDILIKILAEKMIEITRDIEHVCRYGGDSFIVLIKEFDIKVIEEIADLFKKSYTIKGQNFYITASMGISVYPNDGKNADKLITNADNAMYKAKELGKNRYIISSDELREDISHKLYLKSELSAVIDKNELFLMYQPQIDLKSKKIVGVEALLRWEHEKLGLISPARFIPIAESSGLIIQIGEWVLIEAIKQAKQWQNNGLDPINISVNLSLAQFINDNFAQNVSKILQDNEFDAEFLELEITESIAMEKNTSILDTLKQFKKLGIKISMDDFGTHYSSLSRIKDMPIDTLKIAMEFVQNIEDNPKNREITNIIISIAQNLNLKLIAEGAENVYQVKYLEEKFVDIVQGYYFYKPLMPERIEQLLREQKAN